MSQAQRSTNDPTERAARDPRPLAGEPLGLDLVNTVWVADGGPHDLLDTSEGVRVFLEEHGLEPVPKRLEAATRARLLEAREAIRRHLLHGNTPAVWRDLNRVLGSGRSTPHVTNDELHWVSATERPEDAPAWRAVLSYAELVTSKPDRIRRCAGPGCVLHFYDRSRRGDRQWCSMAGCGNRAKAARHYSRSKTRHE
ncbi:CGNR zinc finger domain-containing protein [Mumia quercus]|uniref:CGNR zinc finger domain-containing protein n=1 Tax=Mumia quercus TaxID=2976125 RepID=UPI0021CF7875|nr:CGNR zinc finger domain-containing protein [Mumia quercus]